MKTSSPFYVWFEKKKAQKRRNNKNDSFFYLYITNKNRNDRKMMKS